MAIAASSTTWRSMARKRCINASGAAPVAADTGTKGSAKLQVRRFQRFFMVN